MRERKKPTAVDLFCGCGGVTEGLKRYFNIVAAVDNDPVACATYRHNHPAVHLYEEDIRKVNIDDIKKKHLQNSDLGLLVVCAPCQPFSSQTQKGIKKDKRQNLILEAIPFADKLRPEVIFFENVPGLTTAKHQPLLTTLRQKLSKLGYHLGEPVKLDAADHGVPQRRLRCILIATRNCAPPSAPKPITPSPKRITVRAAIGHLKSLKSGERDLQDPLHFARAHQAIALKRLRLIPKDGGSRMALPARLQLNCHQGHRGHPDVYGRMRWDDISPTLTTGCCDVTRGRFAHPVDDRAISLREAAILQSFPRSYQFIGRPNQIQTQIGNAVPVKLIECLAPTLLAVIKG